MALVAAVDIQRGDSLKSLAVLALTKYGRLGASSRLRSLQYIPWLQQAGFRVTFQPLLADDVLEKRYASGAYGFGSLVRAYAARLQALMKRDAFDVLWIEKEALPWAPLWLERAMLNGVPYVLDFDDAIFHNYDQHTHSWVRRLYSQRLDRLMARAALVVAGNHYLAGRARDAGAPWVEVLPTVIDLNRYHSTLTIPAIQSREVSQPRIVWIGSPSTARYLDLLREPLQTLAQRHSFVFRLIGCGAYNMPGIQVETMPWSEDTEVENIGACDVGVMPLLDSLWEQGKCGYKLIQYMACGLPVVASNVGVNPEIVQRSKSGFLASTPHEWVAALGELLENKSLRLALGSNGRARVEHDYCLQKTGPKLAELLRSAAIGHH